MEQGKNTHGPGESAQEKEFDEARIVARNMVKHGGGFVSHLGEALIRADGDNLRRIKAAFPEYWAKYLRIG